MSPPARRLGLLAHVVASVGWLGAVVASLALGVIGLVSADARLAQGAYVTMEALGWTVLGPLSVLSLGTGLIRALGTSWGLLRHYWVIIKLAMNLLAGTVLLLYMRIARRQRDRGRLDWRRPGRHPRPLPRGCAAGAVVLLLVAAVLSIYKPAGRTRFRR